VLLLLVRLPCLYEESARIFIVLVAPRALMRSSASSLFRKKIFHSIQLTHPGSIQPSLRCNLLQQIGRLE